jgi:hypothetical protein
MAVGVAENPVTYPYRGIDPFEAHLHLPATPRNARGIGDGGHKEMLDIVLEADASAAEACLVFEHNQQLLTLGEGRRKCVNDCLYALNRLTVEMQCALNRIDPLPPSNRQHLVAYLLLWRQIVAPCFGLLGLPDCMRVDTRLALLNLWRPLPRSLTHIRLSYGHLWELKL